MNLTNERTGRLPVERFLNLLFPNPQYREVIENINYFTKMDPLEALLEHNYAQRGNIMSLITNLSPPPFFLSSILKKEKNLFYNNKYLQP